MTIPHSLEWFKFVISSVPVKYSIDLADYVANLFKGQRFKTDEIESLAKKGKTVPAIAMYESNLYWNVLPLTF